MQARKLGVAILVLVGIITASFVVAEMKSGLSVGWTKVRAGTIKEDTLYSGNPTYVGGYIVTNTTWNLSGSPYIVTEDTVLDENIRLTVEPDTIVKFNMGKKLVIDGIFIVNGTKTNRVVFTSNSTNKTVGYWEGLHFRKRSDNPNLHWAIIEFANTAIDVKEYSSVKVDNCTIRYNEIGIRGGWK